MSLILNNLTKVFKANKFNYLIRKYSSLNTGAIEHFQSIVGKENLTVSEAVRLHHAKDESLHAYVL